jgi:hypothetical protein
MIQMIELPGYTRAGTCWDKLSHVDDALSSAFLPDRDCWVLGTGDCGREICVSRK